MLRRAAWLKMRCSCPALQPQSWTRQEPSFQSDRRSAPTEGVGLWACGILPVFCCSADSPTDGSTAPERASCCRVVAKAATALVAVVVARPGKCSMKFQAKMSHEGCLCKLARLALPVSGWWWWPARKLGIQSGTPYSTKPKQFSSSTFVPCYLPTHL